MPSDASSRISVLITVIMINHPIGVFRINRIAIEYQMKYIKDRTVISHADTVAVIVSVNDFTNTDCRWGDETDSGGYQS